VFIEVHMSNDTAEEKMNNHCPPSSRYFQEHEQESLRRLLIRIGPSEGAHINVCGRMWEVCVRK
jgi:hypothetical protein